jgi:HSP20 family protein
MSTSITVKPSTERKTMVAFPQTRDIFNDFETLTNEIARRAFGFFQNRGSANGRDLDDWFRAESELLKPTLIEMSESDTSYTVRAEVPGFEVKDLNVRVNPNSVYIRGKREQKKEEKEGKQVKYSEVSARELCRSIDLPSSINPDKVDAHLTNGVLELTLSKAAPPKKIEVKSAA